jgi:beta-barrel assembly-enhancing protease
MKSYLKFAVAMLASFSLLSVNALPKDKKDDPEGIGNRDVGKGVNFYSIEKEIALGKQMAQEVERQPKMVPLRNSFLSHFQDGIML